MKEYRVDSSTIKQSVVIVTGNVLGLTLEQINSIASIVVLVLTAVYTIIKIVQALRGK
jgi:hypothetical protein